MSRPFSDRRDAGRRLADAVAGRWPELAAADRPAPPLVLGLPRGGVVVAAEVARRLAAPLDALVVRKIGHPFQPEYAIGAIGPDGTISYTGELRRERLSPSLVDQAVAQSRSEWELRNRLLRLGRPAPDVQGRICLVVDDGVATGATALAALRWLRQAGAGRILLAVPVGPADAATTFADAADDLLCLFAPTWFQAVGEVYLEFGDTGDDEVVRLLRSEETRK